MASLPLLTSERPRAAPAVVSWELCGALSRSLQSPGLINVYYWAPQVPHSGVWERDRNLAFLLSSKVMLMLQVWGPHLEKLAQRKQRVEAPVVTETVNLSVTPPADTRGAFPLSLPSVTMIHHTCLSRPSYQGSLANWPKPSSSTFKLGACGKA